MDNISRGLFGNTGRMGVNDYEYTLSLNRPFLFSAPGRDFGEEHVNASGGRGQYVRDLDRSDVDDTNVTTTHPSPQRCRYQDDRRRTGGAVGGEVDRSPPARGPTVGPGKDKSGCHALAPNTDARGSDGETPSAVPLPLPAIQILHELEHTRVRMEGKESKNKQQQRTPSSASSAAVKVHGAGDGGGGEAAAHDKPVDPRTEGKTKKTKATVSSTTATTTTTTATSESKRTTKAPDTEREAVGPVVKKFKKTYVVPSTETQAADKDNGGGVEDSKRGGPKKVKHGRAEGHSVQRASTNISAEVKRAGTRVVFDDDNMTVHQDVYTVTFRNASQVYKTVEAEMKRMVKEAKSGLAVELDKRLKDFSTTMGRMIDRKMGRIRRATAENGKDADTHRFVIMTAKHDEDGVFCLTTAFDNKDLEKKLNRMKSTDKLLLEFNAMRDFNVTQLRGILKENGLIGKSKNLVAADVSDLKELQSFLVDTINSAHSTEVCDKDYSLTYAGAEKPAGRSRDESDGRKKIKRKKGDVRRSRAEEHTDHSDTEDAVAVAGEGRGRKRRRDSSASVERSDVESNHGRGEDSSDDVKRENRGKRRRSNNHHEADEGGEEQQDDQQGDPEQEDEDEEVEEEEEEMVVDQEQELEEEEEEGEGGEVVEAVDDKST